MTGWLIVTGLQLLVVAVLAAVYWFVVHPYLILKRKRREAVAHYPQPEEIWVHNEEMFYIDYVNEMGVGIIKMDPKSPTPYRWRDTWAEWHHRLATQTLFWTGQKKPLGPS